MSGGTQLYLYTYEDAAGNVISSQTIASGLCAGNYTFTVQDANGCMKDTTFTIGETDKVDFLVNANNASCGLCNGEAIVSNIVGGSGGYTTVWNLPTPQSGTNASGICPNN